MPPIMAGSTLGWAPDYVLLSELKTYLRVDDTDDDLMLELWITTASRAVDSYCGRQFGKVVSAEERTYTATYDRPAGQWGSYIDDLQDITGLALTDEDDDAVTDYTLHPVNALVKGRPYTRLVLPAAGDYVISGIWGWSDVPTAVKNATLLQAARLAARRDSPFGVAGSPTEGSELRLLAALDPDLKTSLATYRRAWWAA